MKSFKEFLNEDDEPKGPIEPEIPPIPDEPDDPIEEFEWLDKGGAMWRIGETWYYWDGVHLWVYIDGEWVCLTCDDNGEEGEPVEVENGEEEEEKDDPTKLPKGIPPWMYPLFVRPDSENEDDNVPDFTDPRKPPIVLPYDPYITPVGPEGPIDPDYSPIIPFYLGPDNEYDKPPGWYWKNDDDWLWPLKKYDYEYENPDKW